MGKDTYTVRVGNEALGKAHFTGTFSSYGEAEAYAEREAARSRSFATFEVHRGTPKGPSIQVGPTFRGKH